MELEHFVYDPATPPIIEKLRSKGVAMHAYESEINLMAMGGAVRNERQDRARVGFRR